MDDLMKKVRKLEKELEERDEEINNQGDRFQQSLKSTGMRTKT
jgi:hypothetical protein